MFTTGGFYQALTGQIPAPMTTNIEANARIRFSVAKALAQGRMTFHYQPVVRAGNTRFPAFFEMLARMRLPDGKMVPAAAFLPHVEDGLLGREIDRLALASALKMLAANPALRLSVNISPHSMGDEEWLTIFAAAARGGRGVLGRLILEITEDAALQNAGQTIEFMDLVRRTGCALALDDFGAGATGFRHFREFRFDMVKIDGAFVQGVHSSPDSQVLLDCLMSVADHFEMLTVAERVESEADARWLISRGVDCLQGYLYGKPVPDAVMPERHDGLSDRRAAG
jgi:EAL domain-containing protein (putative c-di-GMP-specific phosphodiesterase class I)